MIEQILLNGEQMKAVNTIKGNLLILASAGTGKTTTIVERYINLVENCNIKPDEIMMTTFTKKAANDMVEKIKKRTKKLPKYIGTMHSLFLKILRDNCEKISIDPNFTLLTEENDKKKIIRETLNKRGIKNDSGNIFYFLGRINGFKSRGITAESLGESLGLESEGEEEIEGEVISVNKDIKKHAIGVYKEYQETLKNSNSLDFDDILLKTYQLLNEDNGVREYYSDKFRMIMIDEAQDLNVVQRNILELLQNDNLCIIGDDCQNIYSWRGASNDLIFKFDKKHKKIILKDNYRSTREIINAVNKIIKSFAFKIDKDLNCTREQGNQVSIRDFYSFSEEIEFLISEVERLLKNKTKHEDIAILFRTNNLGKQIERWFRRNKIPCHLSRSMGFLDREEIRDIIAFLRLKANPHSLIEFERISKLIEGFGNAKLEQLKLISHKNNCSILDSLNYLDQINLNSELKTRIAKLRIIIKDDKNDPINSFLKFFDYNYKINKKYKSEPEKIEDKEENIETLKELYKGYAYDEKGLRDFLDSLIEIGKKEKSKGKIVLSTIHSAKGLEWRYVFLSGCNDTILPFYRGKLSKIKKDDELRLFYVAVSRAKDFLTITHSMNNNWQELEPSQFLEIIEGEVEDG